MGPDTRTPMWMPLPTPSLRGFWLAGPRLWRAAEPDSQRLPHHRCPRERAATHLTRRVTLGPHPGRPGAGGGAAEGPRRRCHERWEGVRAAESTRILSEAWLVLAVAARLCREPAGGFRLGGRDPGAHPLPLLCAHAKLCPFPGGRELPPPPPTAPGGLSARLRPISGLAHAVDRQGQPGSLGPRTSRGLLDSGHPVGHAVIQGLAL